MPAVPVFLDVLGEKGKVEVLLEPDAHEPCDTYRYVDTAGEVGIEVYGIEDHENEDVDPAVVLRVLRHHSDSGDHAVRDDDFLKVSETDPDKACRYVVPG